MVFSTIAAIMALSFIGDMISRRILLPSVILLIITGILFGPILHLLDPTSLGVVVPYLIPLTIAFLGFDSGLKTEISEVMARSGRALVLSVLGFLLSTIVVGVFLHSVFGMRWAYAFLLSSAWGGVSTATVAAVCKHLQASEETCTTLTVSSMVDDLLVFVCALTMLNYISLGGLTPYEISLELIGNLSISFFLGVVIGILWLNILYYSRKGEFNYTFTLAAVLLVFSATEILGGTGGIAIFFFGLILGNSQPLARLFRMRADLDELSELKDSITKFHSELTFILSTFFFVFIGLLYVYTGLFEVLLGLFISVLLHATRLVAVRVASWRSDLSDDYPAIGLIVGKGATAAAVSALPLAANLPNAEMLSGIALNVILITNIISIVLPIVAARSSR